MNVEEDAVLILKQKIISIDNLMQQYNDPVYYYESLKKEYDSLKCENTKMQAEKLKLEMENKEYKKKLEEYAHTINEQKSRIDGHEKFISQLENKIKEDEITKEGKKVEFDIQISELKDNLKKQESKLKALETKKAKKPLQKHCFAQTDCSYSKNKTTDKSIMTDNLSTPKDPFEFYCAHCESKINPHPLFEICKEMTTCPPLISKINSPPRTTKILNSQPNNKTSVNGNHFTEIQNYPSTSTANYTHCLSSQNVNNQNQVSELEKIKKRLRKIEKNFKNSGNQSNPCACHRQNSISEIISEVFKGYSSLRAQDKIEKAKVKTKDKKEKNLNKFSYHSKKILKKKNKLLNKKWIVENSDIDKEVLVNKVSQIHTVRKHSNKKQEFAPNKKNILKTNNPNVISDVITIPNKVAQYSAIKHTKEKQENTIKLANHLTLTDSNLLSNIAPAFARNATSNTNSKPDASVVLKIRSPDNSNVENNATVVSKIKSSYKSVSLNNFNVTNDAIDDSKNESSHNAFLKKDAVVVSEIMSPDKSVSPDNAKATKDDLLVSIIVSPNNSGKINDPKMVSKLNKRNLVDELFNTSDEINFENINGAKTNHESNLAEDLDVSDASTYSDPETDFEVDDRAISNKINMNDKTNTDNEVSNINEDKNKTQNPDSSIVLFHNNQEIVLDIQNVILKSNNENISNNSDLSDTNTKKEEVLNLESENISKVIEVEMEENVGELQKEINQEIVLDIQNMILKSNNENISNNKDLSDANTKKDEVLNLESENISKVIEVEVEENAEELKKEINQEIVLDIQNVILKSNNENISNNKDLSDANTKKDEVLNLESENISKVIEVEVEENAEKLKKENDQEIVLDIQNVILKSNNENISNNPDFSDTNNKKDEVLNLGLENIYKVIEVEMEENVEELRKVNSQNEKETEMESLVCENANENLLSLNETIPDKTLEIVEKEKTESCLVTHTSKGHVNGRLMTKMNNLKNKSGEKPITRVQNKRKIDSTDKIIEISEGNTDPVPKKKRIAHQPKKNSALEVCSRNLRSSAGKKNKSQQLDSIIEIKKEKEQSKNIVKENNFNTLDKIMKEMEGKSKEEKKLSVKTIENKVEHERPLKVYDFEEDGLDYVESNTGKENEDNVYSNPYTSLCSTKNDNLDSSLQSDNKLKAIEYEQEKKPSIDINSEPNSSLCSENNTNIIHDMTEQYNNKKNRKKNKKNQNQGKPKENVREVLEINENNSCLQNTSIIKFLNDYFKIFKTRKLKKDLSIINSKLNIIKNNLDKLREIDKWTKESNSEIVDVILSNVSEENIISLGIVDYIINMDITKEKLDKEHTPPAPPMSLTEQKILALILTLQKSHKNISEEIIKGLQYKLLRLGKSPSESDVEKIARFLIFLIKTKKDRERIRIMLCDAMYSLNFKFYNIMYQVSVCWAEAIPKYKDNNDILTKTMITITMTQQVNKEPYPKLKMLRNNLLKFYNYPSDGYNVEKLREEIFDSLKENKPGADTAMLLLSKNQGPDWSFNNFIEGDNGLKNLIISAATNRNSGFDIYNYFELLGNMLRSCHGQGTGPNTKKKVEAIITSLVVIVDNLKDYPEYTEGCISTLSSLGKLQQEIIAESVLKCQLNTNLRPSTIQKLESFFSAKTKDYWFNFVTEKFPKSL